MAKNDLSEDVCKIFSILSIIIFVDEPPADLFDNDSDLDEQMDQIVEYNNNMELDLLGLENSLTNAEMQEQAVATEKVVWQP